MSVQESPVESGSVVACCRVGGIECGNACTGPFEGGCYYFHYLHYSLASGQIAGREHSPAHQQNVSWLPHKPLMGAL